MKKSIKNTSTLVPTNYFRIFILSLAQCSIGFGNLCRDGISIYAHMPLYKRPDAIPEPVFRNGCFSSLDSMTCDMLIIKFCEIISRNYCYGSGECMWKCLHGWRAKCVFRFRVFGNGFYLRISCMSSYHMLHRGEPECRKTISFWSHILFSLLLERSSSVSAPFEKWFIVDCMCT